MTALRRLALTCPRLAAGLIATALLMKLLVPTGYMISADRGDWRIMLCGGLATPAPIAEHGAPGMHGGGERHGSKKDHDKPEQPCAFAGLFLHGLTPTDPMLLAVAILYVLAAVFRPAANPGLRRALHLRPPSRGPPAALRPC